MKFRSGRTTRIWEKPQFRFRTKLDIGSPCKLCSNDSHRVPGIPPYQLDSYQVFHKVKGKKYTFKHSSQRAQNRSNSAHGVYEFFPPALFRIELYA